MILRGVGAYCQNQVCVFNFVNRISHCTAAECGGQTGHRYGVSKPGTVIDIVGADCRPHKFLEQVIFFIGATRRGQTGNAVGAVFFFDFGKLVRQHIQ